MILRLSGLRIALKKARIMYRLYTIDNTRRSKVKGFWRDDKGKVYVDNVFIKRYRQRIKLRSGVKALFKQGEKSVFYKEGNDIAIIEDRQGKRSILCNRQVLRRVKLSGQEVKGLLSKYSGLTIYNCKRSRGLYFIEIYS